MGKPAMTAAALHEADLAARHAALKQSEPNLRMRDAAERLAVSEGELIAAGCGGLAIRLTSDWADLVSGFPALGRVMALTRNEHCVHEKTGTYGNISFQGQMGLVLDEEIDLRIFLSHWHFGFAIPEGAGGPSIQVFDRDGTAVHKVFLKDGGDRAAYDALVARFRAADQDPVIQVSALPKPPAPRPDGEIDVAAMRGDWDALQDTHDFFGMLRKHGVQRLQAFRLAGAERARPVDVGSIKACMTLAAERKAPIMVFVGSAGVIQIHTGPVETLKEMGPWFNVLDPGFNLHLRADRIASAWIVRKPTRDGTVTSLELHDAAGETIAMLFGKRKPGQAEAPEWRAIVAELEAA